MRFATAFGLPAILTVLVAIGTASIAHAQDNDEPRLPQTSSSPRYGLLGLLDRNSIYGQDWFPEPLIADEADVDNEVEFHYLHSEGPAQQSDAVSGEFEKSFGLLTLEIGTGYESDRSSFYDPQTKSTQHSTDEGTTNIELGARIPFYQYVSPNGGFDTTFVAGIEISPPTLSPISKDTEIVPKIFNLTRVGDHLSIQTGLGDSILTGPESRGLSTIEYDAMFAYDLTRQQLKLPMILDTWAILEFDGERTLNQDDAGRDELFATAGFRFNFNSIKGLPAQPKFGIGYSFPLDQGARQDYHWAIVTSLIFEY